MTLRAIRVRWALTTLAHTRDNNVAITNPTVVRIRLQPDDGSGDKLSGNSYRKRPTNTKGSWAEVIDGAQVIGGLNLALTLQGNHPGLSDCQSIGAAGAEIGFTARFSDGRECGITCF